MVTVWLLVKIWLVVLGLVLALVGVDWLTGTLGEGDEHDR